MPLLIDIINVPPNYIIKNNASNRSTNLPVYSFLSKSYDENKEINALKDIKFKDNTFIIGEIYKDGNCFYRPISSFFLWF